MLGELFFDHRPPRAFAQRTVVYRTSPKLAHKAKPARGVLTPLQRLGYTADLAENGLVAVEAVKAKSYDLVLMDIRLSKWLTSTAM